MLWRKKKVPSSPQKAGSRKTPRKRSAAETNSRRTTAVRGTGPDAVFVGSGARPPTRGLRALSEQDVSLRVRETGGQQAPAVDDRRPGPHAGRTQAPDTLAQRPPRAPG